MKFNFTNWKEYEEYQKNERLKEYFAMFTIATLFLICFFLMMGTPKAHAQELTASWYSVQSLKTEGTWAYSKGVMANGHIFNDNNYTCATRLFPLGVVLRVTNSVSKRFVYVKVTDRISKRFSKTRIDLSESAFKRLGSLKKGLIKVKVIAI